MQCDVTNVCQTRELMCDDENMWSHLESSRLKGCIWKLLPHTLIVRDTELN